MSNPWLRLYTEFAFDPKVQVLTEALQRRYVMALCLHCDNKLQNRPDDEIALALRVTVEEWQETKKEFINRGLFSQDGTPASWEKRQYISDIKDHTSASRQKRYRDRKRDERNATVTSRLPEADTDTDTDKKESKRRGTRFSLDALPPEWKSFCVSERPDLDPEQTFKKFTDHWRGVPGSRGLKLDWDATWRNWVRGEKQNANASRNTTGNVKPTWKSEGERLAAKYAAEAEREEQAAASAAARTNLRLAETIRQDSS